MGSGVRGSQSCSRCRNHGFSNSLKGHKKYCMFRGCRCEKCLVTKDRQRFIAKEIANHRREVKDNSFYQYQSSDTSKHVQIYSTMYEEISDDNSAENNQIEQRSVETRKEQHCSRCKNHGIFQILKGHKSSCPFSKCECSRCVITSRRREVMSKQIKDFQALSNTTLSSPSVLSSEPDISPTPDFENLCIQQFVDCENQENDDNQPEENQDVFFMIQSLFDKYACQGTEQKIQLIHAFTELANFNWQRIELALEKGETMRRDFVSFERISRLSRTPSVRRYLIKF